MLFHIIFLPRCLQIDSLLFSFVILRGQQIRCYSLLNFHATTMKYYIPSKIIISDKLTDFQGGYVMTPNKSVFMGDPGSVLDVMSLYPSVMIAYNLCYSTVFLGDSSTREDIVRVDVTNERKHRFISKDVRGLEYYRVFYKMFGLVDRL